MMPIISAKHISKKFKADLHAGVMLHEVIDGLLKPWRKRAKKDEVIALENVSFDVYPGEVVGLYGHNGAGKSTLLKIIAQVMYPSSGSISINGKCFAMLEIGAGLHGEMNALENISLLAALMGHDRTWAKKHEEQIINFSGLREFMYMPVKFYSSGMKLRLAFSTITTMSPDIVLFDESFAVGDAEFQMKVHERLKSFFGKATAAMIVSHDRDFLKKYCTRIIDMSHGKIVSDIRNERQ